MEGGGHSVPWDVNDFAVGSRGSSLEVTLDPLFVGDDVVLDGLPEVGVTDVNLAVLCLSDGRVAATVNTRHIKGNQSHRGSITVPTLSIGTEYQKSRLKATLSKGMELTGRKVNSSFMLGFRYCLLNIDIWKLQKLGKLEIVTVLNWRND